VVCFSSLDDKSHLSLLSSLAELFEDEKAIEKIIHARTKEEVLHIIKKF
jgi:mannitol/fructose-specific phosphotransferase system IIA component (Ntr-type)